MFDSRAVQVSVFDMHGVVLCRTEIKIIPNQSRGRPYRFGCSARVQLRSIGSEYKLGAELFYSHILTSVIPLVEGQSLSYHVGPRIFSSEVLRSP